MKSFGTAFKTPNNKNDDDIDKMDEELIRLEVEAE